MSSDRFRQRLVRSGRTALGLLAATAVAAHFALILLEVTHLTALTAGSPTFRNLNAVGDYYSAVTFANRNWGFFAPEVTPDWNLSITTTDRGGHERPFRFATPSREMQVKMYSMMGRASETDDTSDLFARSWSVYAMNHVPGTRKVEVELTRNTIPSMAEYRAGARVGQRFFYRTVFER
jgi:hypothetical protein